MLRSLFAGISGLANHQMMLDVVGNNISNINTIGYKSQRITFREMLTQTLRGASRPVVGGTGGTNPQQIGLGATLESIDSNFTQGSLQTTGKMTDMAIEGDGFFVLSDGESYYYSRAGSFIFDALGQLVSPGTGAVVQGILADDEGTIDLGNPLENIQIENNMVAPARATDSISISGNLDADSDALGSIVRSHSFLTVAEGNDLLTHLFAGSNGQELQVRESDIVSIEGNVGGNAVSGSYTVQASSTLSDLISWLNTIDPNATFSLNATTGEIEVTAGADITDLKLVIGGNTYFNRAFAFDPYIASGNTGGTVEELRGPAQAGDLLADLYDSDGTKIVLPATGLIQIEGDLGRVGITPYTLNLNSSTTTVQDLLDGLKQAFRITNQRSVQIDDQGRIVLNGDPGKDYEISGIHLSIPNQPDETFANSFTFDTLQYARDPKEWRTTATIYDSLGRSFQVGITFTKRTGTNLWDWTVDVPGTMTILQGGSGTVGFDEDGRLKDFSFTDQSGRLVIDPGSDADLLEIELDPGELGGLTGLLQFSGAFTVNAKDMEGHGVGTLESISIDRNGVITGHFSNGINKPIAQIALAEFNNPAGLLRAGNNLFKSSANTGPVTIAFAGINASGTISPGQLEMSNVDLAREFTEMIIAQRGFQANARIISVGDEMLSELVTLKAR